MTSPSPSRIRDILTLLLSAILLSWACPIPGASAGVPAWTGLEGGQHAVGFRLVETADRSRSVRADGRDGVVVPRPLRIYMWYPAAGDDGEVLTYARYAALADGDVWPPSLLGPARDRLAFAGRPLARSLGEEGYAALLSTPVAAREGAAPADGAYPVVGVAQGLYYESPAGHALLCELLASHGFVVVATPLVGTLSPLVNLDVIDLETQVRDLEFALAAAGRERFAAPGSVGLLGHDMGAMSALVLAMRNPAVDALVTLDGAVLYGHPSGIPADAPHHDPRRLRAHWLHATQRGSGTRPEGHRGLDVFAQATAADRYLLLTEGLQHGDFTSYALIADRGPVFGYWTQPAADVRERYRALCRYVVAFLDASLRSGPAGRDLLGRDPDEVAPGLDFSLEHRAAGPPAPVYSDFLNALLVGETARAKEVARRLADADPEGPLLQESVLNRLGYHLISSWELFDEGIAVFELNVGFHPGSAGALKSLGNGHLFRDEYEAAAVHFRKALELDPDDEQVRGVLARIDAMAGQAP